MTDVESDYRFLLVYGVVSGGYGASEDDPDCAEWISALRERAAADRLRLEVGFHLDMADRDFPRVRIARRDGGSFAPIREIPNWPFAVEREWRQTLEAARRRAGVGRFTPPPPEHLRPDLNTLYQDGILLPHRDENWWLHHWQQLTDVSTPTGCPVVGRWLTDRLWAEERERPGGEQTVEPLAFLSLGDPTGARYDLADAGLDRRDLEPFRLYMRRVLERDFGIEQLTWLRAWARGENSQRLTITAEANGW